MIYVLADLSLPRAMVEGPHPELGFQAEIGQGLRHRNEIAESMRQRGWDREPLLVHPIGDGTFQAWMGMHRLFAAEDAGLLEVPVVIVSRGNLIDAGFSDARIDHNPWEEWQKLENLSDPRPAELQRREGINQAKRGF